MTNAGPDQRPPGQSSKGDQLQGRPFGPRTLPIEEKPGHPADNAKQNGSFDALRNHIAHWDLPEAAVEDNIRVRPNKGIAMRLTGVLLMAGLLAGLYDAPASAKDLTKAPAAQQTLPDWTADQMRPPQPSDTAATTPAADLAKLNELEARWKGGEKLWKLHPDGPDTLVTQDDFNQDRAAIMARMKTKTGKQ